MDSSSTRHCVGVFASVRGRRVRTLVTRRRGTPRLHLLRGHLTGRIAIVIRSRSSCGTTMSTSGVLFNGTASRTLHGLSRSALLTMFRKIPRFRVSHSMLTRKMGTISLFISGTTMFTSGNRVHGLIRNNNISLGGRGLTTFSRMIAATSLLSRGCLLIRHNGGGCCLLVTGWWYAVRSVRCGGIGRVFKNLLTGLCLYATFWRGTRGFKL